METCHKNKTFNVNPSITDDFKGAIQQYIKRYFQSPQKLCKLYCRTLSSEFETYSNMEEDTLTTMTYVYIHFKFKKKCSLL